MLILLAGSLAGCGGVTFSSSATTSSGAAASSDVPASSSSKADSSATASSTSSSVPVVGESGLQYVLNPDGLSYAITGYEGTETSLTVDPTYQGLPITRVADYAFGYERSLVTIDLSKCTSLTSIGTYAFEANYNSYSRVPNPLVHLYLPSSLKYVGQGALLSNGIGFFGISMNILECNVKDGLGYLGNANNPYLVLYKNVNNTDGKNVEIPEGTAFVCEEALSQFTGVSLPNSLLYFGSELAATSSMGKLALTYTVKDGLNYLGNATNPYLVCAGPVDHTLTSLTLAEGCRVVRDLAFGGCTALTSVTLPSSLVTIGMSAFNDDVALTNVTIPADCSLSSIMTKAFYGCLRLTSFDFAACSKLEEIEDEAFGYGALTAATIPAHLSYLGYHALYGGKTQLSVDSANRSFSFKDNFLLSYDETQLFQDYILTSGLTELPSSRTLPSTVKRIGPSACAYMPYTTVTLPSSLETIDSEAFLNSALTSISLPDNVISIGPNAFKNSNDLTSLMLSSSLKRIQDGTFYECGKLESATFPSGLLSIGANAFYGCKVLGAITLPDTIQSIGDSAFFSCSKLSFTALPSQLKSLGVKAFAYDDCLLTLLTLPQTLTSLGERAFEGCSGLVTVDLSGPIKSIEKDTFNSCDKLTTVTLPSGLTSIGEAAFEGDGALIVVTGSAPLLSIGKGAFYKCYHLTSFPFGDCLTTIEDGAFDECERLTNVSLPATLTSLSEYAFSECSSISKFNFSGNSTYKVSSDGVFILGADGTSIISSARGATSVAIPDSFTTLDGTFSEFRSLTSIVIPATVKSIGDNAFYDCKSLTSITFLGPITSIGDNAFYGCKALTSIVIPSGVTSIGKNAFEGCSALTSVTLPDTLTSIGQYAFENCSDLANINLPDSLTTIEKYAFDGCYDLKTIFVPISVTTIGDMAFFCCEKLSISCEAASKPSGWSSSWNPSGRPVTWGATR